MYALDVSHGARACPAPLARTVEIKEAQESELRAWEQSTARDWTLSRGAPGGASETSAGGVAHDASARCGTLADAGAQDAHRPLTGRERADSSVPALLGQFDGPNVQGLTLIHVSCICILRLAAL